MGKTMASMLGFALGCTLLAVAAAQGGKVLSFSASRHPAQNFAPGLGSLHRGRSDREVVLPLQTDQLLYLTTIQLGTPPQYLRVQVDTGSDLLWTTCRCTPPTANGGCVAGVKVFNDSQSTSFNPVGCADAYCSDPYTRGVLKSDEQCGNKTHLADLCKSQYENSPLAFCPTAPTPEPVCNIEYKYGDTSGIAGFVANETLTVGCGADAISVPVSFGCAQYLIRGTNAPTVSAAILDDGIISGLVGVGPKSLFLTQVFAQGGLDQNTFSHCLHGSSDAGGDFVLGLTPPTAGAVSAKLLSQAQYYGFDLESIGVQNRTLQYTIGTADRPIYKLKGTESLNYADGALTDSGSTFTSLTMDVHSLFVQNINKLMPAGVDFSAELSAKLSGLLKINVTCWVQTDASLTLDDFPKVLLNMASSQEGFQVPPNNIFGKVDESNVPPGQDAYCSGVDTSGDKIIIGAAWLTDILVTHDFQTETTYFQALNCSDRGQKLQTTSFPTTCDGIIDSSNVFGAAAPMTAPVSGASTPPPGPPAPPASPGSDSKLAPSLLSTLLLMIVALLT